MRVWTNYLCASGQRHLLRALTVIVVQIDIAKKSKETKLGAKKQCSCQLFTARFSLQILLPRTCSNSLGREHLSLFVPFLTQIGLRSIPSTV